MRHESDISVLHARGPTATPSARLDEVRLTVECKNYASASDLKAEVRKNLGMVQDWARSFHPSRSGGHPRGCIHCGLGFGAYFATNVRPGQRLDIELYLEAYELGPHFGVVPGTARTAHFINVVRGQVAQM